MARWIFIISFLFFTLGISSQDIGDIVLQMSEEESFDVSAWEDQLQDLEYLHENPLDINTATREQWEQIPFLPAHIIENIQYYLYKYGAMQTIGELMMVEDMDARLYQLLQSYVCIRPAPAKARTPSLSSILRYGRHELVTRMDLPLYQRRGYRENIYEGEPWHHTLRYQFHYSDHVYAGITADKDAGEPFFRGGHAKGYDSYSPYFYLKGWGRLKALALGNYRIGYGYGLVANMGMNLGKTTTLTTLESRRTGIRKHASADEYNYLQGIAASYELFHRWIVDVFGSYRHLDGTLTDEGNISSLKKDGLHRRDLEYDKRNTLTSTVVGGNVRYDGKYVDIGLTALYQMLSRPLIPTPHDYNRYYPQGTSWLNTGINYRIVWHRWSMQGETAIDKDGNPATANTLRYSPRGGYHLLLLQRYYSAAYSSLLSNGIGEGSATQNESGLYLGIDMSLIRYVRMTAYADFFYFPWYRYQVSRKETNGIDATTQLTYTPPYTGLHLMARYRYKRKYRDHTFDTDGKQTLPFTQQRIRLQASYSPAESVQLRTTADHTRVNYQHHAPSMGWAVNQSIGYRCSTLPLQADISYTWFHTDDYDARISLYEKSLLYSISSPSVYYKGSRLMAIVRYEPTPHFILQAKYASTIYRDRDEIGSGYDLITGNRKSDIYLQLRIKF